MEKVYLEKLYYGDKEYDVTGVEYCEWEDKVKLNPDDPVHAEWCAYDVLIGAGYFISPPTMPRPTKKGKAGEPATEYILPASYAPNATNVSGEAREPLWTQSRILLERDKLLKEREKMLDIKESALKQKINETQILINQVAKPPASSTLNDDVIWKWFVRGLAALFLVWLTATIVSK
jgi:hypothetical protein